MTERENFLRTVHFQNPEWIPSYFYISDAAWDALRWDMEKVLMKHPKLFPDFQPGQRDYEHYDFGPFYTKGKDFIDAWGTTWRTPVNGIEGCAVDYPIKTWDDFAQYSPPDPQVTADRGPRNWELERKLLTQARKEGKLTVAGLPHGFLFLRLEYLRGFENMLCDMMDEEPKLDELIEMIVRHNEAIIRRYVDMQIDCMEFGEDLGTQTSTIASPALLRRYIFPQYKRMFNICKEKGVLVLLHSDGMITGILEDLLKTGVDIINPQDLCNGIEELARQLKGRVCIRLDIDRQRTLCYGTPKEIDELIEYEVKTLGSKQGGLELVAGIYPPIPPENVDALMTAVEKYQSYWRDK